ncbi:MAG: glycosylase/AP lyase, DNA-binding [Bacteroidota bacterium]|nr:glycosylase/AP lyase, DNA-binding [Bacteroidota bacterium]
MPEGPSIVILREECMLFKGKRILKVSGNSKIGIERLAGQKVVDFKSWGKQLLICFKGFTVRIHLLMFGSYRINERKDAQPRLSLQFKNGELNFYTCSVKFIEEDLDSVYDWEVDTMSDEWNLKKVLGKLKEKKNNMLCDVLLDQEIFAGSGNIVKNEVLFRLRLHPETLVAALTAKKLKQLALETRQYCFDFYEWKKKFELKKHWQVYKQKNCPNCGLRLTLKHLGKHKRRTFFCEHCQVLKAPSKTEKLRVKNNLS